MGAGSYRAGAGAAGFDPLASTGAPNAAALVAWMYDPATRSFPFTSDGAAVAVHPVDQAVVMAATIALRSLAAAPDTGGDLDGICAVPRPSQQSTVTRTIGDALAALIAGGDITFFGAPIVEELPGRLVFEVDYANLRLPGSPRRPRLRVAR